MGTTFVPPTSINVDGDATGLGKIYFHPYTLVHYTLPGVTVERGAWAAATAYAVNNLVTYNKVKWICVTAHTSVGGTSPNPPSPQQCVNWLPLLNSGEPIYLPGHANYLQVSVPLMEQLQTGETTLTHLVWPDIGDAFMWWMAHGWAPGDALNKHHITDTWSTRNGTDGDRNTIKLRGPNLFYAAEYGISWGDRDEYEIADTFNEVRYDWPPIDPYAFRNLNLDYNRSRIIQNDSRWNFPAKAEMRANITSDFEEYPDGVKLGTSFLHYDTVEQIEALDRKGVPLTLDPAWGDPLGGQPIGRTLAEFEVFATKVDNSHIYFNRVYQYQSSEDHGARHKFSGQITKTSPWITSVVDTALGVNQEWVGLDIQGLAPSGMTIVEVDTSNPANIKIRVSANVTSNTSFQTDLSIPYIPVEITRALVGRIIKGYKGEYLPKLVQLFEDNARIDKVDPTTRVATIVSDSGKTPLVGDIDGTTVTADSNTWWIVRLKTKPIAAWVGKVISQNSASSGLATGNPSTTITAIDDANPANYRIKLSRRPGATTNITDKNYNIIYSDGPVEGDTLWSNYGGFEKLWLGDMNVLTSAKIAAPANELDPPTVDNIRRTIKLYDSTPNNPDTGARAAITIPHFNSIFLFTVANGSDVVTITAPKLPIDSGWLQNEFETFSDETFGTRPTVAKVIAIAPTGGLAAGQVRVDRTAVKAATNLVGAVRANVKRAAIDVTLPKLFGQKVNGVQLIRISSPQNRPAIRAPRDRHKVGVLQTDPRGVMTPGTNVIHHIEVKYGNGYIAWYSGAKTDPWWFGVDPAWADGLRGVSDDKGLLPWNAKIVSVNVTDPSNIRITIDKTIPTPAGQTLRGAWSFGTTYAIGDRVSYGSADYVSLVNGNLGRAPAAGSSYWSIQRDNFQVDDTVRTRVTGRCRFYDSTVSLDGGLDEGAGGLQGDNAGYADSYEDYRYGGDSIFFNWHGYQMRACEDIEIDHHAVKYIWADPLNFGPGGPIGQSIHPTMYPVNMQAEGVAVHDMRFDGSGRQFLTLQGNSGFDFYRNWTNHTKRWFMDTEVTTDSARAIGVKLRLSNIDAGGSGDFYSVQSGFQFSLPPNLMTGVQFVNGSDEATILNASLAPENAFRTEHAGSTVTIPGHLSWLPDRTYIMRLLGINKVKLSAAFTGTTGTYDALVHPFAPMRDFEFSDLTLSAGNFGANIDGYLSKGSVQQYSSVEALTELVKDSFIGRIISYSSRDDGTSFTLNSTWINRRVYGPAYLGGGYLKSGAVVTEIGPNGTDLPTSSHFRLNKAAVDNSPAGGLVTNFAIVPVIAPDWKFLRLCQTSPFRYAGDNAAAPFSPLFCLGRFCDYVVMQDCILVAKTNTAGIWYALGWRDTTAPNYKTFAVHGKPPLAASWIKSGNQLTNFADTDFLPAKSITAMPITFDHSPHNVTDPITVTATLTPSDVGGVVDGQILFYMNTVTTDGPDKPNQTFIGRGTLSGNVASLTIANPGLAGTYYFWAVYTGGCSIEYRYKQTGPTALVVGSGSLTPSVTTVTVTPDPSTVGDTHTIDVTVTGTVPSGIVTLSGSFTDPSGSGSFPTQTLALVGGHASFVIPLAQGTWTITASYAGDGYNLPSSDDVTTVVEAPSVPGKGFILGGMGIGT